MHTLLPVDLLDLLGNSRLDQNTQHPSHSLVHLPRFHGKLVTGVPTEEEPFLVECACSSKFRSAIARLCETAGEDVQGWIQESSCQQHRDHRLQI